VDWTTIPNTGLVKSFPRVKHIPCGPPFEHQGMEIEVHGQAINPHRIELPQQIGQPTPNTSGRVLRTEG
jgi:hypothetical protein